jgi:hypothetical protein
MVSCLASVLYKISYEAYDTSMIMKSRSLTMSTICIFDLLSLEFFHDVGFIGETFIFLDVFASSRGLLSNVTLP